MFGTPASAFHWAILHNARLNSYSDQSFCQGPRISMALDKAASAPFQSESAGP